MHFVSVLKTAVSMFYDIFRSISFVAFVSSSHPLYANYKCSRVELKFTEIKFIYCFSFADERNLARQSSHIEVLIKPGPVQIGAISKAQKYQKDFKMSKDSLLQHPKNK